MWTENDRPGDLFVSECESILISTKKHVFTLELTDF